MHLHLHLYRRDDLLTRPPAESATPKKRKHPRKQAPAKAEKENTVNEFATDLEDLQLLPEETEQSEVALCGWTCSWTTAETL